METMTSYPVTPQTQVSHMRHSSRASSNNPAQFATRNMQAADKPASYGQQQHQQPLSAPGSQESFVSVRSDGSSVLQPHLQSSSSSNLSQLTNYTDPTSPAAVTAPKHLANGFTAAAGAGRRAITPENQTLQPSGYVLASPMSVTSPVSTTNGAKRTASGHVKNAPSLPSTPMMGTFAGRARAESMSSTGSRAGELAATLKTRLGYAMAKVQHGWEHKNIAEVEQLAAQKMSPNRHSMSHLDYSSRRPMSAGLSNGTSRLSMHEGYGSGVMLDGPTSPPSKRRSGTYSTFLASPLQAHQGLRNAPLLQPPADIRPTASSQHSYYHHHPNGHNHNSATAMSPPRTPISSNHHNHPRRPPTIRTDTQTAEAERDALQALFQLGSPHASQVSRKAGASASQASSNQASPLRGEFGVTMTPRRVTFARSESGGSSGRGSSGGEV
jgi:hypothetical protein